MPPELHLLKYFARHFLTATRKGHGVHSPFAYQLCEEVFYNKHLYYDFEKLNKLRKQLLNYRGPNDVISVEDFGAGSRTMKEPSRKISQIARTGISGRRQSEMLYRLCHFLNCRVIVELGTSLGVNALYLAQSSKSATIYTLEGSGSLVEFAKNISRNNRVENIEFLKGKFDNTLPALLEKIKCFDLLYIDGDHTYESTIRYFSLALKHIHPGSVIVLDDIYWSSGMTRAWNEIKNSPHVSMSIDTFYSGIIFFRNEVKHPQHFRMWLPRN